VAPQTIAVAAANSVLRRNSMVISSGDLRWLAGCRNNNERSDALLIHRVGGMQMMCGRMRAYAFTQT